MLERAFKTQAILPLLILLCIVAFRCLFFLVFGESQFDSDQAVYGIMAKDIATLRAFPSTYYGQKYLLAYESYITAPFFALFGSSIATLKFPLFLINLLITIVLYQFLYKKLRFSAWESFFISVPIACAPIIPGIHMMAAEGGSIEPYLYILVLYFLKDRSILLGLFLGFAYGNREFSILGFFAILALDVYQSLNKPSAQSAKSLFKSRVGTSILAFLTFRMLHFFASFSLSYFGPSEPRKITLGSLKQICENTLWLITENLPEIFGLRSKNLLDHKFQIQFPSETQLFLIPLTLLFFTITFYTIFKYTKYVESHAESQIQERKNFGLYLFLVAIGNMFAYVLFVDANIEALDRYTLLCLYFPVGVLILFFALSSTRMRILGQGFALFWILENTVSYGALYHKFLTEHPQSKFSLLYEALDHRQINYALADYWTSYYLDFLSDEKIHIGCYNHNRINRINQEVLTQKNFYTVSASPCENGEKFIEWYICGPFSIKK